MLTTDRDSQSFDLDLLSSVGLVGRTIELKPKECFFAQGYPADDVFCIKQGRVKVSVVSPNGKQAVIALLSPGDFFGEESLASAPGQRKASTTAVCNCTALKFKRVEMLRAMHQRPDFCDQFLSYLLARNMRFQDDLVDHLFNPGERRLARVLLLMAESGRPDETRTLIPPISQETLAEMIGTTRSRVSFFMNRFRNLGLIDYKSRIQVHKPQLQAVLFGQLPAFNQESELVA
jgi:CRP-like cAMP-binding protein